MYRGHILAQYEIMFDIAVIDGDRKGGQDFLDRLSLVEPPGYVTPATWQAKPQKQRHA
jgi:hypothetical protein